MTAVEQQRLTPRQKEILREAKEREHRGCSALPRQKLPEGKYLVHNHVHPVAPIGKNGFRAWTQKGKTGLVRCHCDFGGNKNASVNPHYHVAV